MSTASDGALEANRAIEQTKTAKLLELVAAKPGIDLPELSAAVYGELEALDARRRVTTLVGGLVLKGKLRRVSRGRYAIVEPKKGKAISTLKIVAEVVSLSTVSPRVNFVARGGELSVPWPPGSELPKIGDVWVFEGRRR